MVKKLKDEDRKRGMQQDSNARLSRIRVSGPVLRGMWDRKNGLSSSTAECQVKKKKNGRRLPGRTAKEWIETIELIEKTERKGKGPTHEGEIEILVYRV